MKGCNPSWPVLTSYDRDHVARVALPLGGIGTGTVSLGGRGDLRDWEIVNRSSKGFQPRHSFFAIYARKKGGAPIAKVLEGPVDPPFDSEAGFRGLWYGLPRFRNASFHAAYPLGQVLLSDPDMPVTVRLEGFNPLVPCDLDASGLPVAVLRYVVTNPGPDPVMVSVCGNVNNFIGTDGVSGEASRNVNTFRKDEKIQGLLMSTRGVSKDSERWGTVALTTTAKAGVSHRTGWFDKGLLFESLADYWDEFSGSGGVTNRADGGVDAPMASLAVRFTLPARSERAVTFLITWCFPNRMTWTPEETRQKGYHGLARQLDFDYTKRDRVGNYYATVYKDAWQAAGVAAKQLGRLEERTIEFVSSFCGSDLPDVVKEAALYNLSTLRSQTCFRTEDGRFYGWEGCNDKRGCCLGSCTHVWNYEQATAFLFGDLAKSMREIEFKHMTKENGHMSFRVYLPIADALEHGIAAADGQMGCIMKLYRDWQLSGDDAMLRDLWPNARKTLEFAWIPGGWDADRDGVMEGAQHNTTDLEFYGPNPLMAGWYLGALRAAEEMARYLGDEEFAAICRGLFDKGSAWVDENLFNGEYYEQRVQGAVGPDKIAAGLTGHIFMEGEDVTNPPQQPEKGCMTDQLVGQFMAHICGLGHVLKPKNIKTTLRSIMKHNFLTNLYTHANPVRAFALQDERMLVYGTYPKGDQPERPCFRFFENWTGVEYAAAVLMMQEGRISDGLKVFRAVRDRFDGRRRSPFDEPECGHHYARAMASWAGVTTLTGFRYSGVDGKMTLASFEKPTTSFWSNGYAWGTFRQKPTRGDSREVEISVSYGRLKLKGLELSGFGAVDLPRVQNLGPGKSCVITVKPR